MRANPSGSRAFTQRLRPRVVLIATLAVAPVCSIAAAGAIQATVLVEEDVYSFTNPDNGSGPFWSYGCTTIARVGERVFVSQMETGEGVPPLCNTRWRLLERTAGGWKPIAEAEGYRQREPCPLATDAAARLFLNVNDSLMPPGAKYQACEPHLLAFDLAPPSAPRRLLPRWTGDTHFTDHSYRGYAMDRARGEILMLNINAGTSMQHWTLLTTGGETLRGGGIAFPIRACYPQVALNDSSAHVLAIGDIVEPNEAWRTYKKERTGRDWDYVFRRLFYTWTDNVHAQDFAAPVEIANVDATAGHISNQDLWIAPNGDAYVMYSQSEVASALLRDKFFPDKSTTPSLYLAILRQGGLVSLRTMVEGSGAVVPGTARFHETPDGRLYALVYLAGATRQNVLMQVYPQLDADPTRVPFTKPFSTFTLASVRAGNRPSNTIDVLGINEAADTVSYAAVQLN